MPSFHLGQSLPVGDFSDISHLRALAAIADGEGVEAFYLEERQGRYLDPYVVLADIAQRDQVIVLGICQPLDGTRAPSVLAKTLSGLNVCSEGRGALALGVLDDKNPMPAPATAEALAVMQHMNDNDETTFVGTYFSVDRAWNTPRCTTQHAPFVQIMPAFAKSHWSHEVAHPGALGDVAAQVAGYALVEVSKSEATELLGLVTHFRSELKINSLIGAVLVDDVGDAVVELSHLREAGFVGALCRWPRLPDETQLRELIERTKEEFD